MFKYTSPMQPVSEEYEQSANAEPLSPNDAVHELSGQDGALILRIKKIRDVMDSLRLKLAIERDKLARERMEAASMFTYQSTPVIPENFVPLQSFYSLPVYNNYNMYQSELGPTGSVQNYESLLQVYNYENDYRDGHPPGSNANYLIETVSNTYRDHLQEVEKMCQEEFDKMQESISSLRKSKLYSGERSSEDEIPNSSSNVDDGKRLHRQDHRSGHKRHALRRKKIHRDNHRSKQRSSDYFEPDDPKVLDEHRSHYYYHYNDLPIKRRYLSKSRDIVPTEETSGDSTETSGTLWHLDSPYYSDYD